MKEGFYPTISAYYYDYTLSFNTTSIEDCKAKCYADDKCQAVCSCSADYSACYLYDTNDIKDEFWNYNDYDVYYKSCGPQGENQI